MNDVQNLSDTGALGALVDAARDAGYYTASRSEGARVLHLKAIEERETLLQEVLRRLRERRNGAGVR